ncbi:MAG: hypothetical protein RLZZ230_698 [Candidatus Parcubacteria bacterium]|jgi:hypothetical protein
MMRYIISTLLYLGIAIAILQNWLIVAVVFILIFSMRHGAILLLPMAIIIDGYFGNFYTLPMLSFTSVWWYLVVLYFRPILANLRMTKTYESLA